MYLKAPNRPAYLHYIIVAVLLLYASNMLAASADHFVTSWKTDNLGSSNSTSITIPIWGGPYDVDWNNDGIFDEMGLSFTTTHDFTLAGTYTIRIRGSMDSLNFNSTGDIKKLVSIDQWGSNPWTTMQNAFKLAINLEVPATDAPNLSLVTDLSGMFFFASIANPDTSSWNTSTITNMASMFQSTANANPDVSSWNTSMVSNTSSMFQSAASANPDVSSWSTPLLSNANSMFMFATAAAPDMSNWDVSSLSDAGNILFGITLQDTLYDSILVNWSVQSLQTSVSFNAGNSSYCSAQAAAARALIILNFSWTINDAGLNCTTADAFITSWNTSLSGTSGLNQITVPMLGGPYEVDWDNDGIYDQGGIVGPITHTFGPVGLHTIRIRGSFDTIRFNNSDDMLKILSVDQWGTHAWTSMFAAFYGAANLQIVATGVPDLSSATNLQRMFWGATQVNPDVSNWDTSTITNMASMFRGASMANPDVSNWNTAAVIGMANMFLNASSFNRDLSNWSIGMLGNAGALLNGSGFSAGNYDRLLISWSGQTHPNNIALGVANANYCSALAVSARAVLISDGWSINDAGPGCASTPAAAPDLLASSDTGKVDTDNVTMDNTADFDVTCSSADDQIRLYSDLPVVQTLLATKNCASSATETISVSPAIADGQHHIHYTRVLAGVESAASPTLLTTIDTQMPTGPGNLIAPSGPIRDASTTLTGTCGIDSGNGTVKITTLPANGFNSLFYNNRIFLFLGGEITLNNPDWNDGSWDIYFDCTDLAGNGPAQFGPFGPVAVETSCDGIDVFIQAGFPAGIHRCQGSNSITTSGSVVLAAGAVVHFQSPNTTLGTEFSVQTGAEFTSETTIGNTPPHIGGPEQIVEGIGSTVYFNVTHYCDDYEDGSLVITPANSGVLSPPAESEFFVIECADLNGAVTQKLVEIIKN